MAPVETKSLRVLLTGGGRGVGAASVRALAQAGFGVTFTYRSASTEADALVAELAAAHPGQGFEARALDLTDKAAVEAFAATVADESYFGFVHNAGMPYDTLAAMMDQDKAEVLMQVNYWSFTRLAKAVVRGMMRARAGRIVGIGSIAALRGSQGNAPYAGSKAAIIGYAQTLAAESARRGITVNVIAPGFVDTDMLAPYAAFRQKMEAQIPLGRFVKPEEVAGLVAFLLSPPAGAITGQTLVIDGGLSSTLTLQR
ncbi:SDR family NAD(P)-dependent oxidoreductase [Blastochloris tepida]|uniref:3-oxoacyl-[acyl-carrier-protein] reductase FabG n=1 Tax=Blastochloris tepida TaxID=2233851 RepID=A0A348G166_9HYPH|nr:SDR family oxidoreductase [Blastochloris tepida]BBF93299.1 3-oxoacyl-[acyl-carrier-protein] reductase FabG [Blastochloris tepida]